MVNWKQGLASLAGNGDETPRWWVSVGWMIQQRWRRYGASGSAPRNFGRHRRDLIKSVEDRSKKTNIEVGGPMFLSGKATDRGPDVGGFYPRRLSCTVCVLWSRRVVDLRMYGDEPRTAREHTNKEIICSGMVSSAAACRGNSPYYVSSSFSKAFS